MERNGLLSLIGRGGESPTIETLEDFGLGGVDCPLCQNKGYIISRGKDGFSLVSRECECMTKRRALRSLRQSGLEDLLKTYTLESYQTPDAQHKAIKQTALSFLDVKEGWFFLIYRQLRLSRFSI